MTATERHARWRERVKGTPPPSHGTTYAYSVYRCRCGNCKEAMRACNARRVWVPRLPKPRIRVVTAKPRTAPVNAPTSSWWACEDFGAAVRQRFVK